MADISTTTGWTDAPAEVSAPVRQRRGQRQPRKNDRRNQRHSRTPEYNLPLEQYPYAAADDAVIRVVVRNAVLPLCEISVFTALSVAQRKPSKEVFRCVASAGALYHISSRVDNHVSQLLVRSMAFPPPQQVDFFIFGHRAALDRAAAMITENPALLTGTATVSHERPRRPMMTVTVDGVLKAVAPSEARSTVRRPKLCTTIHEAYIVHVAGIPPIAFEGGSLRNAAQLANQAGYVAGVRVDMSTPGSFWLAMGDEGGAERLTTMLDRAPLLGGRISVNNQGLGNLLEAHTALGEVSAAVAEAGQHVDDAQLWVFDASFNANNAWIKNPDGAIAVPTRESNTLLVFGLNPGPEETGVRGAFGPIKESITGVNIRTSGRQNTAARAQVTFDGLAKMFEGIFHFDGAMLGNRVNIQIANRIVPQGGERARPGAARAAPEPAPAAQRENEDSEPAIEQPEEAQPAIEQPEEVQPEEQPEAQPEPEPLEEPEADAEPIAEAELAAPEAEPATE